MGVLQLPASVLHMPSSNIRSNTGCTALAITCTVEPMIYVYFRSLTWVYCICYQVFCISFHVNQEPHLVYCICQQVYCICHHVHQKPHWRARARMYAFYTLLYRMYTFYISICRMCTFYDILNNFMQFSCAKAFQQVDQDVGTW